VKKKIVKKKVVAKKKISKKPALALAKKPAKKIELTARQQKVLAAIKKTKKSTIEVITKTAFPGVRPITRANSWVRNQLRGLRAAHLIKRVASGTYIAL
jgi:hypothetical protein